MIIIIGIKIESIKQAKHSIQIKKDQSLMEHNSDGLFQLTCECNNIYAPELKNCSACGKDTRFQKALHLDNAKFFERMFTLQNSGKKDDAMDVLFDVFWQLHSRFDIMNNILADIPLSKIDGGLIVGVMSNTFAYKHKLSNFVDFCNRVAVRLKELGSSEEEVTSYMRNFRDADVKKHWGDMAALGVPNGLFGVSPGNLDGDK